MNKQTLVPTVILVAVTLVWTYRDTFGDICPAEQNGCKKNINLPCPNPNGQCLSNTGYFCTDRTRCSFVKGTAGTNPWPDCVSDKSTSPSCTRTPMLCVALTLYKSQTACANNTSCGTDNDDECTFDTGNETCAP
jgi:hypothetical protein